MITRMSIVFTTIITSHQTWSSGWVILLARALTGVFSLKMGQSIFQFEGYFILHSRFSLMDIAIVLLGFTDCLSVGVGFQYISEVSELRNRWKHLLFCRYECHYLGLDWINGAKLKASQLQKTNCWRSSILNQIHWAKWKSTTIKLNLKRWKYSAEGPFWTVGPSDYDDHYCQ